MASTFSAFLSTSHLLTPDKNKPGAYDGARMGYLFVIVAG